MLKFFPLDEILHQRHLPEGHQAVISRTVFFLTFKYSRSGALHRNDLLRAPLSIAMGFTPIPAAEQPRRTFHSRAVKRE